MFFHKWLILHINTLTSVTFSGTYRFMSSFFSHYLLNISPTVFTKVKPYFWNKLAPDIHSNSNLTFIALNVSGGNGKPVTSFSFVSVKNNEIRKEYLGIGN